MSKMRFICASFVFFCALSINFANKEDKQNDDWKDYYWRVYNGVVPTDAVPGGLENNNVTYIGQVLYGISTALIPAVLKPGRKYGVATAMGNTFSYDVYVTILCSEHLDHFKWVYISIEEFASIKHKAVIGGTEIGQLVYIGRGYDSGRLIIGKVFENHMSNKGLWIHNDSKGHTNLLTFDVLVYE